MFTPQFDDGFRQELAEMFGARPNVDAALLYGTSAWYAAGEIFACLYGDVIAFRIGRSKVLSWLLMPGVELFMPMDGKMGLAEWVQLSRERFTGTDSFRGLFEEAYVFALSRSGSLRTRQESGTCPAAS
jgi:hypothetical protein